MPVGQFLLILFLFILMGFGVAMIFCCALPYLQNKIHGKRIAYISLPSREVGTWFIFKLETNDIFAAFNPINVSVYTSPCDPNIKSIQLEFLGASSYFPGDYNFSDPYFFPEQFEKLRKAISSNILILKRNSPTTFAGKIQNLTYRCGGEFDIGITVTYKNGKVVGYGVGNTNFVLKKAIKISPPEALIQLRNSNLTLGLSWMAVGLTLIAIGLSGLIDLLIQTLKI